MKTEKEKREIVEMINANLLSMISQFKSNPMQMLSQRYNIPNNMQNPQDIIQHLLNTGQISQQQVNSAMQLKNNPNIQSLFK